MDSSAVDERVSAPTPQLSVTTTAQTPSKKPSSSTMTSDTLSPSDEKNVQHTVEIRRDSDISSPCSVHHSNPFDTDIEAMMPTPSENLSRNTTSNPKKNQDCQVWPGKDHWKRKAKAAKKQRSCTCMAHLSRRTRLIVKFLIALLVIGIAVGVGVGISKPLGARIWQPKDS